MCYTFWEFVNVDPHQSDNLKLFLLHCCFPGYTSLHLASCWGHLETVRTLLELGADTEAKTFRGERPVDLARKYSKTDCADCLMLKPDAEADNSGVD